MAYLDPYFYFIVISLIVSMRIFMRGHDEYRYLRTFPVFLTVTLAVELLGLYLSIKAINNTMLYNIFSFLECSYFLWLVSRMIRSRKIKNLIRIVIVNYALAFTINVLLFQRGEFHTITYSIGCLLIVLTCILFFLELFRNPKSVSLVNSPNFWICSALLFWCSCTFPLYGFINFLSHNSPLVQKNFLPIVTILNIFLYSLFTIAFLCMKPRKYISSPS